MIWRDSSWRADFKISFTYSWIRRLRKKKIRNYDKTWDLEKNVIFLGICLILKKNISFVFFGPQRTGGQNK